MGSEHCKYSNNIAEGKEKRDPGDPSMHGFRTNMERKNKDTEISGTQDNIRHQCNKGSLCKGKNMGTRSSYQEIRQV